MRERYMAICFEYILLTGRLQAKTDGAVETHTERVFSKTQQVTDEARADDK